MGEKTIELNIQNHGDSLTSLSVTNCKDFSSSTHLIKVSFLIG